MLKYAIKPMSNVASAKRNVNIMNCEAELKTALCAPINIIYQLVIEIMETITSERYKNLYRMKVKIGINEGIAEVKRRKEDADGSEKK